MRAGEIHADQILRQLDELWVSLGGSTDGEHREEVLRACTMTLLVLTAGSPGDPALGGTLAALMRNHPSRAIVIGIAGDRERRLIADVTARCWMPFGRSQQICSEQIEITATATALDDLPPVIRGLTAADLPLVIWTRATHLLREESLLPVLRLADKLIVASADRPDFTVLVNLLRPPAAIRGAVSDLSWTRLTRWRAAIADSFHHGVQRIRILHRGSAPPPAALYLAAWLKNAAGQALSVSFTNQADGAANEEIREVLLEDPGCQVSISRTSFAPLAEHDLLAEELSLIERDPVFEAALERVAAP